MGDHGCLQAGLSHMATDVVNSTLGVVVLWKSPCFNLFPNQYFIFLLRRTATSLSCWVYHWHNQVRSKPLLPHIHRWMILPNGDGDHLYLFMFYRKVLQITIVTHHPGSWFNLLTLLIVGWCSLFALPKLYLNNQVRLKKKKTIWKLKNIQRHPDPYTSMSLKKVTLIFSGVCGRDGGHGDRQGGRHQGHRWRA